MGEAKRRKSAVYDVRELLSGYCIDLMKRGLAFPGPVPPDDFLGLVREFFTNNPCKWVSVIPDAWTSRQGEAVH